MMQLSLIDPRLHPVATKAMLDDNVWLAIRFMRAQAFRADLGWPHVEHIHDIGRHSRPVWAVDDDGLRYVVTGRLIFRPDEFDILDETIRTAAREAFGRLDAIGRAA